MIKRYGHAVWWLLVVALTLAGCARRDASSSAAEPRAKVASNPTSTDPVAKSADLAVLDRKVIKTGTLTLTVDSPAAALSEARSIAERQGGYLLNSANAGSQDGQEPVETVTVSLKVRAERFDAALADLRRLGSGSASESIESKDVTEEYVDVDARLRTQKRVEEQYLTLLKDAKNVNETLEVHKQLTIVRTEIERLEGKQRLLEHQVQLSTINLTFAKKRPLYAVGGGRFGSALKQAGADAINVGAAIVIFTIRAAGVLIPFGVLLLLPAALLLRLISRRFHQRRAVAG